MAIIKQATRKDLRIHFLGILLDLGHPPSVQEAMLMIDAIVHFVETGQIVGRDVEPLIRGRAPRSGRDAPA